MVDRHKEELHHMLRRGILREIQQRQSPTQTCTYSINPSSGLDCLLQSFQFARHPLDLIVDFMMDRICNSEPLWSSFEQLLHSSATSSPPKSQADVVHLSYLFEIVKPALSRMANNNNNNNPT